MISIVIPIYNEQENIIPLCQGILESSPSWKEAFEVIFVNDGSTDQSSILIRKQVLANQGFRLIELSRNFGHQAAISAGIQEAKGDAVILMDGDMQDPPQVLIKFIEAWREGNEVVYGIRTKRKEGFLLKASYKFFYMLLSRIGEIPIPEDSGDFCLMDRRVVDIMVHQMPEQNRFIRGLRAYAGFKQIGIPFERESRLHGETKYSHRKLRQLAFDGLFGFSAFPLKIATYVGFLVAFFSFLSGTFFIVHRLLDFKILGYSPADVPGLASLAVGLFFLSGITLMILGIIGEYIGRIYFEVKKRPLFIIREIYTGQSNNDESKN